MQGILTFVTCVIRFYLRPLHHRFVIWTKPDTTSFMLGMLTDLARSKSELVAENALLRQQLIILRRQVKQPACTKTDRIRLVFLARIVRCTGYLDHPFKNKHAQTEKELHSLLANTGGLV